jgi:hypothetical protein
MAGSDGDHRRRDCADSNQVGEGASARSNFIGDRQKQSQFSSAWIRRRSKSDGGRSYAPRGRILVESASTIRNRKRRLGGHHIAIDRM